MNINSQTISDLEKGFTNMKSKILDVLVSAGKVTNIILGLIGLYLVVIEAHTFYKIYRINKWPTTTAKITEVHFENKNQVRTYNFIVFNQMNYDLLYRTRIGFEYEMNGKKYIGSQLSYYEPWVNNPIIPKIENDMYSKGSNIEIKVNPSNYEESYVINKPYDDYSYITVGIILCIIFFVLSGKGNKEDEK